MKKPVRAACVVTGVILLLCGCATPGDPAVDYRKAIVLYQSQDYENAEPLFENAADHGNASAQFYLGLMYYNGKGVSRSLRKAYKWFSKAAQRNEGNAQVALAYLYYKGEYADRDIVEACKWLLIAERNRAPGASDKLQLVKSKLTDKEIAEATKRADAWQPGK